MLAEGRLKRVMDLANVPVNSRRGCLFHIPIAYFRKNLRVTSLRVFFDAHVTFARTLVT